MKELRRRVYRTCRRHTGESCWDNAVETKMHNCPSNTNAHNKWEFFCFSRPSKVITNTQILSNNTSKTCHLNSWFCPLIFCRGYHLYGRRRPVTVTRRAVAWREKMSNIHTLLYGVLFFCDVRCYKLFIFSLLNKYTGFVGLCRLFAIYFCVIPRPLRPTLMDYLPGWKFILLRQI
jgi:hypothetical protein